LMLASADSDDGSEGSKEEEEGREVVVKRAIMLARKSATILSIIATVSCVGGHSYMFRSSHNILMIP